LIPKNDSAVKRFVEDHRRKSGSI